MSGPRACFIEPTPSPWVNLQPALITWEPESVGVFQSGGQGTALVIMKSDPSWTPTGVLKSQRELGEEESVGSQTSGFPKGEIFSKH